MSRAFPVPEDHDDPAEEDPMDDAYDDEQRLWWGEHADDFEFERR